MNVSVLNGRDSGCDTFVRKMAGAKLCHTLAWARMLERTFGHKVFYLAACEGADIHGVLPLTQVRSRLFGNRMISQAFSNYGGPLATNWVAVDALYQRAVELAIEHRCESIEFRNTEALPYGLQVRNAKVAMYLSLAKDADQAWRGFRHNIRNRIRKAEKSGLVAVGGGLELLDDFYRLWTLRMHQLGTPCYPRKLFRNFLETFPENTHIMLARMEGKTVGGIFVHRFNDLVEIPWGAAMPDYNALSPTSFLWWSIVKRFSSDGISFLDLGRSTVGSGPYEFKRRWGAQPIQLSYQYWTPNGHKLNLVTPDNPRYRNKVELWKRLPLWMTRLAGPQISRNLP